MARIYHTAIRLIVSVALLAITAAPMLSYSATVAPNLGDKRTYGLDKITLKGAGDANPNVIDIAGKIINWFLGFLGIIAVILVLISGFQWMTAESEDKVKEAQKRLFNSVIGLAIVALAWVIGYAIINSMTTILGGQPPTPVP